jgi:molybdate transport system ATP-binding protein
VLRAELDTAVGSVALDVALEVEPGECLALVGPSGAGKTSVLRAVAGLLQPARGLVECGGEVWLDTRARVDVPPERRGCGYLFQEYALFPHLSAWRNVAYGLRGAARAVRRERALELLERFGLEDRAPWRVSPRRCCSTSRCRHSTRARAGGRRVSWRRRCAMQAFRCCS